MNIAVIGSGISGLSVAHYLSADHEVHVFEKASRLGGHTATIDVEDERGVLQIDTGFIVYNTRTYPNFVRLLDQLGVDTQESSMSFSVSQQDGGFEYAGNSLNSLFAQRRHLASPRFWRMLSDIVRFNKEAERDLHNGLISNAMTLGEYLTIGGYSDAFVEWYLLPMGAAIWSTSSSDMLNCPLMFFIRFFSNHGLLSVFDKPKWRVIKGGSAAYIPKLISRFEHRIHLNANILSVRSNDSGASLHFASGRKEEFDHVVFACHSDQALALIAEPSKEEREVLGAIPYCENDVILHTDTAMMPRSRRAWSSWNYRLGATDALPVLTYHMNRLQNLSSDTEYCVSLNAEAQVNPEKIHSRYRYAHPQFTLASVDAQQRWASINNRRHLSFCGAYWGYGFHEDGLVSALRVAKALGVEC